MEFSFGSMGTSLTGGSDGTATDRATEEPQSPRSDGTAGAPGGAPSGAGGNNAAAADTPPECICCKQPRHQRSRFCKAHKAVVGCIYRDAKTHDDKVTASEGVKCTATCEAHNEVMKDDTLAALKIIKYETENPNVKTGKKRGNFDHCEFSHNYTTKKVNRKYGQNKDDGLHGVCLAQGSYSALERCSSKARMGSYGW